MEHPLWCNVSRVRQEKTNERPDLSSVGWNALPAPQFPRPVGAAVGGVGGSYAHARLSGRPVCSRGHSVRSRQPDALRTRQGGERRAQRAGSSDVGGGGSARLRASLPRPFPRRRGGHFLASSYLFAKLTRGHRLHLEQPNQERTEWRANVRKALRGCAFPPLNRSRRG